MLNAIRADIYRISRSKVYLITQAVMAVYIILVIAVLSTNFDTSTITWTSSQTLMIFTRMSYFITYFLISLFIITVGYDLIKGSSKNLFSSGVSRSHFFFSKYLIFNLISLLELVLYYAFAFIVSGVVHGLGEFTPDFLGTFFGAFALQLLFIQAIFAVGIFVLYLSFSSVWAVLTIVVSPTAASLLNQFLPGIKFLTYFNFQGAISSSIALPHALMGKFIISAFAVIIILNLLSHLYFQKKDL